jgi:hypothetical protein
MALVEDGDLVITGPVKAQGRIYWPWPRPWTHTSSIMAISALSPRRGTVRMMRV